jgi:hypothetical protein
MGTNTKEADIEYPFELGEVFNYTLDGVSIHPVYSFRRGRKPLRDFTMKPMVTIKQSRSLMAVIGEHLEWINNIVVTPQY